MESTAGKQTRNWSFLWRFAPALCGAISIILASKLAQQPMTGGEIVLLEKILGVEHGASEFILYRAPLLPLGAILTLFFFLVAKRRCEKKWATLGAFLLGCSPLLAWISSRLSIVSLLCFAGLGAPIWFGRRVKFPKLHSILVFYGVLIIGAVNLLGDYLLIAARPINYAEICANAETLAEAPIVLAAELETMRPELTFFCNREIQHEDDIASEQSEMLIRIETGEEVSTMGDLELSGQIILEYRPLGAPMQQIRIAEYIRPEMCYNHP